MEIRMKETKRKLMQYRILLAHARGVCEQDPGRCDEVAARAMMEREWLEEIIQTLPDPRQREVLSLRYLHGLGWEDIAERMYYSLRWVMKLHRAAIIELGGVI